VGAQIPVVVGRNGLAWGNGLHGAPAALAQPGEPLKREGDGKAPAGAFKLSAAFGYTATAPKLKLPYIAAGQGTQCVDDASSLYYNRVLERAQVKQPNWRSHEDMRRRDDLYRWGVIVDHNTGAARKAGGGSCIFLHIWAGPAAGTAGCTAMEAKSLEEVLYWLDAKKQPVLAQAPQAVYQQLRSKWQLLD
jgi:D-alanyl-D-alanine dipeptidase